ncbi:imidazoleglycerol-phosphate dehydratase HisB [Enterococcus xiangfangensis]|uniref:Imidazoleglycerol-phosphate dehydratase n=1 Tax=Enterococcus xiangfangensis TaxID=1296537 RepID=A0ABU3FAN9_9ENTE|nr:imidazoleglycerol-phosphate dehydratase HisB [Enterococcus xiangfangensis]MDT2759713.1 imidazoleglycerol-phosphate dehydratase HisB [Enterococcus xiangfangensis]
MRKAEVIRQTSETKIQLALTIDGTGQQTIKTKIGFLDHMLELFVRHGRFDLALTCDGDIEVDAHHTTEDIAIALGRAFSESLGERRGIMRYGSMLLPMDEALVMTAVDISGRGMAVVELDIPNEKIGQQFDTELVEEFFIAFARELGATIHLHQIAGKNSHHIVEACFKGFGRALGEAIAVNQQAPDEIPSTKGTIK